MRRETLGREHFEALYAARPDPWRLATSDYERAKYAATLAALPRARYAHGLEIGCAMGILTAELGRRCDALLAVEPVASALAEARERTVGQPHIRFEALFVPAQWPEGCFDLVVLSEVVDYLGADDVLALAARVAAATASGGDVILVHWVGKKRGVAVDEEASDRLIAAGGDAFEILRQERNPNYRLDLLRHR